MLDEMFDSEQTSSNIIQHNFFFFFQIFKILKMCKPVQHFIQHHENTMLDEMLDWFAPALIYFNNIVVHNFSVHFFIK